MTTITTSVSRDAATALIHLAGGTENQRGGWDLYGRHYWQTDEALMVALETIAENAEIELAEIEANS